MAYVYTDDGATAIFTVNCYEENRYFAVSPNHEPHHRGFYRHQLRAIDVMQLPAVAAPALVADDIPRKRDHETTSG